MISLTDRGSFAVAVGFYALSAIYTIFLFRRGFRKDGWINYLLLVGAFIFHTLAMMKRGFSLDRCPINNLYEATTFIAWTVVTSSLFVGVWPRLRFITAFASPLLLGLGVFALMPVLDVQAPRPTFTGGWSGLHKALILLSYGSFGLACVAGVMYLLQDRNLKVHKARAVLSLLPAMERLDLVIGRMLVAGFILLTAGILVSAAYLKQTHNVYVTADPQLIYSAFVWLLYLCLILMRWRFSQKGRRFALGAIGSFAFIALTFWGVYLLSGLHHP